MGSALSSLSLALCFGNATAGRAWIKESEEETLWIVHEGWLLTGPNFPPGGLAGSLKDLQCVTVSVCQL